MKMRLLPTFCVFVLCLFGTSTLAATPKAETFKLGSIEKKVELVDLQGAGCEVRYQGEQAGWAKAHPERCESIYGGIVANLNRGGYVLADASGADAGAKSDAQKAEPAKSEEAAKGIPVALAKPKTAKAAKSKPADAKPVDSSKKDVPKAGT